ncbi:HIT family protein [Candidatus Woesearchaeota archaeon]|nr:HIT family protein [Candidatus Woesearchaeota archaeon]
MADCIFCKIAQKEIPADIVYEDEQFLAFLDNTPRNPGHTLIIPKKHYRWVWDMEEESSQVTNKIANALKKAFNTDLVISFVLGEEVPHAHIHLIPRFPDDGHGTLIDLKNIKDISQEEMSEIAKKITTFL